MVVNPLRVADRDECRRRIVGPLTAAGWPEPIWLETTAEDPGSGQARRAIEEGAEVVFVCGGDGTVMSCLGALAGTDVALALLPSGTGNLLATNLGLANDLDAAVAVALQGGRRRIDLGDVDGKLFAVMAGMGFDAQMIDATSERAKKWLGWPAYVVAAVRHLRERGMRTQITVDGRRLPPRRTRAVLVGNVGRLQGGVPLLSAAVPDDGLLDVAVLSPRTLRHWWQLAWGVLLRRPQVARMETFTAERVEIVSDRPQPRELDGDLIEPDRMLRVTVRRDALWLCVPQPDDSPDLAAGAQAASDRFAGEEPAR